VGALAAYEKETPADNLGGLVASELIEVGPFSEMWGQKDFGLLGFWDGYFAHYAACAIQ
jgi:hypothetical protein